jgi:uncharacterized protein
MLKAYTMLRSRVDRFADQVVARWGDQIVCRAGCSECCQAGLTLTLVEAVAIGESLGIAPERVFLQAGQPSHREDGRCVLLDESAFCRIYGSHPIICRTHGLPLKYPEEDRVRYCEKNFNSLEPHGSAVFDIAALEKALFAVNVDYCRKQGFNPLSRVAIDRLASLMT